MATPAAPTDKQPWKYRVPRVPVETPVLDDNGKISRNWVLFLQQIGRYSTPDAILSVTGTQPTPPPPPPAGSGTLVDVTLTAPTTMLTTPVTATAGAYLTHKITQDATGNRHITWSPDFLAFTVDLSPFPNRITVFLFTGQPDGTWLQTGDPCREI